MLRLSFRVYMVSAVIFPSSRFGFGPGLMA